MSPVPAVRPLPCRTAAPRLAALAVGLVLLAAASVHGQPADGVYLVRYAPILACGGFGGECRSRLLEGTLELDFGSSFAEGVRIVASDLRLRAAEGGDDVAFPHPGDLTLPELVPDGGGWVLVDPAGGFQDVRLELRAVPPRSLALSGTYDEGCCDRFVHHFGNTMLERLGPAPAAVPFLPLDRGLVPVDLARYQVEVDWATAAGGSGHGNPVPLDAATGYFWFFRADNPELYVKLLHGCETNGHLWLFVAGLTNVEVEVRVRDRLAPVGEPARTYRNPQGRSFEPILDTAAFPCPPAA
jgi:hypothetical protein